MLRCEREQERGLVSQGGSPEQYIRIVRLKDGKKRAEWTPGGCERDTGRAAIHINRSVTMSITCNMIYAVGYFWLKCGENCFERQTERGQWLS